MGGFLSYAKADLQAYTDVGVDVDNNIKVLETLERVVALETGAVKELRKVESVSMWIFLKD